MSHNKGAVPLEIQFRSPEILRFSKTSKRNLYVSNYYFQNARRMKGSIFRGLCSFMGRFNSASLVDIQGDD